MEPLEVVEEKRSALQGPMKTSGKTFAEKLGECFASSFKENPHPELGNYIHCHKIMYATSAVLLGTPVYLGYDAKAERYVVKKCFELQRAASAFSVCCIALSVVARMYSCGKRVLENTNYIVPYFDFMNEFVLNLFIFAHVYIHWFRLDLLTTYVDMIQTTPLLRYCETPVWKTKFLGAFFSYLSLHLPVVWFFIYYGYDFSSMEAAERTSKMHARDIFWLDKNAPVEPTLTLCIIAAIGRFYTAYGLHLTLNVFCHVGQYCTYFVTDEFFNSLLKKNIAPDEVLDLLDDFKVFMRKTNGFFWIYNMNFTTMTMSYHSVHLFDCLNATVPIWKLQSYMYILYVLSFYTVPQTLFIKVRKLRLWLRKNDNCCKIPHLDLNSILYDLLDFQFGIRAGRMCILNREYCGTAVANMISYSMLNMLSIKE